MRLTHFKNLPKGFQILIGLYLFGLLFSFQNIIQIPLNWNSPFSILGYVTWPFGVSHPISTLIHIFILWTIGVDLYYQMKAERFYQFYLSTILILSIFAAIYAILLDFPGNLIGPTLLDIQVLIIAGILFSERKINVFFVFEMPMKYAAVLFVVLMMWGNANLLFGFQILALSPAVLWGLWWRSQKMGGLGLYEAPKGQIYQFPINEYGERVVEKLNENQQTFFELDRELDNLLKKISEVGNENLTEREQARLIEISQKMKERKGKI